VIIYYAQFLLFSDSVSDCRDVCRVYVTCSLCSVVIVESSPVVCEVERADSCMSPFQDHLEKGVAEFVALSDRDVADACL